jgi:hypothetical protein
LPFRGGLRHRRAADGILSGFTPECDRPLPRAELRAEEWATWSIGQTFGIKIPLGENPLPKTMVLEAHAVPNLSAGHPNSSTEVLVNGVPVGVWEFRYVPQFEIRRAR